MQKKLRIAEHPWEMVAFGALAGIWLATYGKGKTRPTPSGLFSAAVGTLIVQLVRDAAMFEMSRIAKLWIAEPQTPPTPYAS